MHLGMRLDPAQAFDSSSRGGNLATRSVRGGISTLGGQLLRTGITLVGTVVLARLLTPSDYGLVAMAAVVVALAQLVKDGGLVTATVQASDISEKQISSLFWVTLGISTVTGGAVLVAAPLVAAFYKQPALLGVTAALSLTFIFDGIALQQEALLRRHMLLSSVVVSDVVSQAMGVAVGITAALLGAGYWSLVFQTMTASLISSVIVIWYCPWIPGRYRRGTGSGRMVRFGGDIMAFDILTYFGDNTDYLLIGKFMGAEPLGLYTRAFNLFALPMRQVRRPMGAVALPALSALREQPERFAAYYRRFVEALALLSVPIAIYCFIEVEFIIRVLLGEQWMGVVPVFRIFAVAGLFQAVASTRGMILVACGFSRRYLHLGVVSCVVRVTGVLIGLPFGITGVAASTTAAILLFLPPSLHYFMKGTPVRPRDFYRALARPLLFGTAAGLVGEAALRLMPDRLTTHAVVLCLFVGVYAGLAWSNRSIREDVRLIAGAWHTGRQEEDAREDDPA